MAKKPAVPKEQATAADAVAILTADHKRVAKLFAEFANLKELGNETNKSKLVATICQELIIHTALEEEIFYPAVRRAIDDKDQMDEALVEHAGAKDLIAQLQGADPSDDLYDAKVTVLGEQVDHHVEEEEGSMFPQAKASELDLISLGADLVAKRQALLANPDAALSPTRAPQRSNSAGYGKGDTSSEKGGTPSVARKPAPAKSANRKAVAKPSKSKTSKRKR